MTLNPDSWHFLSHTKPCSPFSLPFCHSHFGPNYINLTNSLEVNGTVLLPYIRTLMKNFVYIRRLYILSLWGNCVGVDGTWVVQFMSGANLDNFVSYFVIEMRFIT